MVAKKKNNKKKSKKKKREWAKVDNENYIRRLLFFSN